MTQHSDGNTVDRILSAACGEGAHAEEPSDAAKRILAAKFDRPGSSASQAPVARRILAARFCGEDNRIQQVNPPSPKPAPPTSLALGMVPGAAAAPKSSVSELPAAMSKSVKATPRVFSIAVTGPDGSDSLRALEAKLGPLPSKIFVSPGGGSLRAFPITAETVDAAIAAQGEIAPGLQLQAETRYTPPFALASKASAWLSAVLASRQ